MTVAADLLEDAARLTKVYASGLAQGTLSDPAKLSVVPGRVFILKQNDVILGVLVSEQRAVDEAHAFMHAKGGTWSVVREKCWRWSESPCLYLSIDAHDVR